jgi:hypothetical protein
MIAGVDPQKSWPLDEPHYHALNNCIRECGRIQGVIDKAKAAGLDWSDLENQNKLHANVASNLKKQFFPDLP